MILDNDPKIHDVADTMALDCSGNLVLLAGRNTFYVKHLNESSEGVEKYSRNHRYDFSTAEWNPSTTHKQYFALTINERVLYALVRESGLEVITCLKYHTRQVTDLNWHRVDPDLLATASADTHALIWDTRDVRRPVVVFSAVAGANQVRWNKLSRYLIATSHDSDIRIWDQRKGTVPVQYIAAHSNKIHSMDWSPTHEYQLASCSQDCSIKLFDMTNPRRAENIMHTSGPVWRVRYTPWGEGLMTAAYASAGEESSLQLWNLSSHSGPVHTFVGSLDVAVEAQWRQDGREYQLVTWCKDQFMRIWPIEPFLQRLCGYLDADARADTDSDLGQNSDIADAELAVIATMDSGSPISSTHHMQNLSVSDTSGAQMMEKGAMLTLEEEFDYLLSDKSLPNITCENVDISNRSCIVRAFVNSYSVSLLISFPPSYPYNAAPSFQIEEPAQIDPVLKTKLLKVLKQTAQQKVRKNRTCLDSCLNQLISSLEGTVQMSDERQTSRVPLGSSPARIADAASVYSSFYDNFIPYPKSSGARFCSAGMLVCFNRPPRVPARLEPGTPRSWSAATNLSYGSSLANSFNRYAVTSNSQHSTDNDMGFFLSERQTMGRTISRSSRPGKMSRTVSIYDASKLFFIHKELAMKYVLDMKDIVGSCSRNAVAAASVGRPDLVQVWNLTALAAATDMEDEMPWSKHPFSTSHIEYLIQHYAKASDVQTAAMLSCVFPYITHNKSKSKSWQPILNGAGRLRLKGSSPYHTIHPSDTSHYSWTVPVLKQHIRSNSWSESAEEASFHFVEHRHVIADPPIWRPRRSDFREELKRRYADILHMWGLLQVRTTILKLLDCPPGHHSGLDFLLECQNCKKLVVGSAFCVACLRFALRCSICRILVRGASNVCLACGHGGHASHMYNWFSTETICPSGCGCHCPSETRHAFDT